MKTKYFDNNPIFRFISFSESGLYSPWTARLTELESWNKTARNFEEVLRQYNEGYGSILKLWEDFSITASKLPAAVTIQRFFYQVAKHIAFEVEKNKHIYGSSKESYLFSSGDELCVGDLLLGEQTHQNLIIQYIDEQISKHGFRTIVETGSGTGVNLFYLYLYLNVEHLRGGEICPNGVELANRISQKFDVPAEFSIFDYRNKSGLHSLTEGLDNYLLITCHSVAEVQVQQVGFIENILSLPNPPKLVIHFEGIIWNDDSIMSRLCRRYAEKNNYNLDLLETILKHEEQKHLEIIDMRKRCWGLSAFYPTSIVSWRPVFMSMLSALLTPLSFVEANTRTLFC